MPGHAEDPLHTLRTISHIAEDHLDHRKHLVQKIGDSVFQTCQLKEHDGASYLSMSDSQGRLFIVPLQMNFIEEAFRASLW